jgi:uncharacterized membrane protein
MKLLKLAFRRETAMPMLALTFASLVCGALVLARITWTGNPRYAFLLWNLFLAWLPLAFSLLAFETYRATSGRNWRFLSLALAWLLFFPNAPYIFTDLIHLTTRYYPHFWVDLTLILLCAMTGFVLGFVSLFLMHAVARRILGQFGSWVFIAGVAGLSGFGIYLGRFMRFNSWDVVFQPLKLYRDIGNWANDPLANPTTSVFPFLFATFLFTAYVMLYALTHLKHTVPLPFSASQQTPSEAPAPTLPLPVERDAYANSAR